MEQNGQMADTNEQGVIIQGHQINAAGSVSVGHIGDSYQIARAQINISDELANILVAALTQEKREDYSQAMLLQKLWEPETVLVSAGPFLMGSQVSEGVPAYETPQFTMTLPAYRIGKYPVTNKQYAYFIKETEQTARSEVGWPSGNEPSKEQEAQPVRGVTWYDALAYCLWLIKETGRPYTLPSEAQWEKAARGSEGNLYPWGNDWQDGRFCNMDINRFTAVTQFPEGKSPYDCWDMVGNVREWTTSLWGRNRRHNLDIISQYPWEETWAPNSGHDDLKKSRQFRRVTRGGASLILGTPLRAARRESELPYYSGLANGRLGFRVALNWEDEK